MVATNRFDDQSRPVQVRLEYLKRRKVLRLWSDEPAREPIEIHRAALLEALGDDPEPEGAPPRFLLIAGIPGRSGSGDEVRPLVTAFEHEDQARAAFRSLRMRAHPKTSWAQVLSLTGRGRPRPICWFGTAPAAGVLAGPPANTNAQISEVKPVVRRRRTWPRRRPESRELPSAPGSVSPRRARRAPASLKTTRKESR